MLLLGTRTVFTTGPDLQAGAAGSTASCPKITQNFKLMSITGNFVIFKAQYVKTSYAFEAWFQRKPTPRLAWRRCFPPFLNSMHESRHPDWPAKASETSPAGMSDPESAAVPVGNHSGSKARVEEVRAANPETLSCAQAGASAGRRQG